MESTSKKVTTMPTNSSVGVGEFVDDFGDKTKVGSGDVESDDCPPHELVYSSKEGRRVRWKLDTILLPLVRPPNVACSSFRIPD